MNIDTNNTMAPCVTIGERAGENTQRRLQAIKEIAMKTPTVLDNASVDATGPYRVLQTALTALSQGNFVEVVDQFNDQFTFTDRALNLEHGRSAQFADTPLREQATLSGYRN